MDMGALIVLIERQQEIMKDFADYIDTIPEEERTRKRIKNVNKVSRGLRLIDEGFRELMQG